MPEVCNGQHQGCATCFKIKLHSIQFQGMEAQHHRDKDDSIALDMAAYKSFRDEGMQPKHVGGSYQLAQGAETKAEVENHVVMTPEMRRKYGPQLNAAHERR